MQQQPAETGLGLARLAAAHVVTDEHARPSCCGFSNLVIAHAWKFPQVYGPFLVMDKKSLSGGLHKIVETTTNVTVFVDICLIVFPFGFQHQTFTTRPCRKFYNLNLSCWFWMQKLPLPVKHYAVPPLLTLSSNSLCWQVFLSKQWQSRCRCVWYYKFNHHHLVWWEHRLGRNSLSSDIDKVAWHAWSWLFVVLHWNW